MVTLTRLDSAQPDFQARPAPLLLVEPMRGWRARQCRMADVIVTPAAGILPPWIPRGRVLEIEWGADTERFHPGAPGPLPYERRDTDVVAVFAGAFRSWHGAQHRFVMIFFRGTVIIKNPAGFKFAFTLVTAVFNDKSSKKA